MNRRRTRPSLDRTGRIVTCLAGLSLLIAPLLAGSAGASASPGTMDGPSAMPAARAASGASAASAPSGVRTAAVGDPVVVAAGDISCQPPNSPVPPESKTCQQFATADLIDQIDPTAVLALGDLQYNNATLAEFMGTGGYNETWGRRKSITHPTIGDNEYEVVHGEGYWDYWNGTGNANGQGGERGKGWYSFDVGTWHLISLNSEEGGNNETWIDQQTWNEQLAWLQADVAAHPNACTLAYWHEPLFSTGSSYSQGKAFEEILHQAGADVVLSGHAHRYERYAPQDPDGNATPTGIRHWTVGTGGKSINPVGTNMKNVDKTGEGFGVLKLTLHPGSYDWQFVNAPGTSIQDSGSAQCVGGGVIPEPSPSVSSVQPGSVARGQGNAVVTLAGSGFSSSTTVDFGAGVTVRSVSAPSATQLVATVDVGSGATEGARDVTVRNGSGTPSTCTKCFTISAPGTTPPPAASGGYWFTARDGGIFAFGDAAFKGSTGALKLAKPIVGMTATPSGAGYWMVASDGGIFAFGDAAFKGSTGNLKLTKPIIGMAPTPSGQGYWLVASDGGVFAFGDAAFKGSTGALKLAKPIVGMAPTRSSNGYWLVASDGGIFAFGDAAFKGSTGALKLAQPIVGMAATATGNGYWLVASDGGVFAFGDAVFKGSTGDLKLAQPIVGMAASIKR